LLLLRDLESCLLDLWLPSFVTSRSSTTEE
jgi:hypothetical protein